MTIMDYFSNRNIRSLAGCVAFLLNNGHKGKSFDEIFKLAIDFNQMNGLLEVDGWREWAMGIVFSAFTALKWY